MNLASTLRSIFRPRRTRVRSMEPAPIPPREVTGERTERGIKVKCPFGCGCNHVHVPLRREETQLVRQAHCGNGTYVIAILEVRG